MGEWSRRGLIAGGAAAGTALLTGARLQPASGAPEFTADIVTGERSFVAPDEAPAGPVTFRVRTTSRLAGVAGLARLRPGQTESAFRTRLRRVFAAQGDEAIAAGRELMATAELFGGAMVHLGAASCFTAVLKPGRYLLFEYLDFEGERGRDPEPGHEHVRTLTVHDASEGAPASRGTGPRPPAVLTAFDKPGAGPRFALNGRVARGRLLRYTNRMRGQVDEAVLYPVDDPAVTSEDIQSFFENPGQTPPFDMTSVLGTPPLSPGESVLLRMPLHPGRYAIITWVTSMRDARPLSAHGQHLLITAH